MQYNGGGDINGYMVTIFDNWNSDVKSKFEAEQFILQEINNGLNAQILRLGNITNRYTYANKSYKQKRT